MQNISIHTLEELCDVLHSESNDTIVFDNDIKITDVIDISFDHTIDLNGHHLTLADSGALTISNNTTTIENGYVDCNGSTLVNVLGKDTVLQLSQVRLTGEGCLLMVKNRGQATITASNIASTKPDANNCIIYVEGATIAKLNSSVTLVNTNIYGGNYPAVSVTKRGILNTSGGLIHTPDSECTSSDESAIVELNDTVLLTDAVDAAAPEVDSNTSLDGEVVTEDNSNEVAEVGEVVQVDKVDELSADKAVDDNEIVTITDQPTQPASEPSAPTPSQILLSKPTHIYGSPSTRFVLATYIGPVTPVAPYEVVSKPTGNFVKVTFKAPGVSRRYTGYILVKE